MDSNARIKWLVRIVFLWAACIMGRLVQLQIVQHDTYRQEALQQQEHVVELTAARGTIVDRTGERLALSIPCQSVCINPMRVPDLAYAADLLARFLDLDSQRLYFRMKTYADAGQGFLWVKRKISDSEAKSLHDLNLDWIEFRTESKRVYAYGGVGAHLLGGVDFEEHGNSGVELSLNEQLAGHTGMLRLTTDVKMRGWKSKLDLEAQPGNNIRLTVMARLQYIAEQRLKEAVETHRCKTGTLVVMDPKTGEILALANYPSYDPNARPGPKDDLSTRENLAVAAPFEPGSVFKVITIAAALETTKLRPESVVSCGNGSITLAGRTIHDHNSYSALAVEDVLARSSNIGAINIGLKVGDANMYEYLKRFGFGRRTGVPLPGESGGLVEKLRRWQKGSTLASVSMGHEVSVTSLQLAQACSVIANGGYLVQPKLVMGAKTEGPRQVLRPETAITMRHMMEGVVTKPWGTGHRYANIPGYSSGGKTGTAQIFDFKTHSYTHLYNASFMGFAPVNNPAVVVVVTVNGTTGTAGYGGPVSAPVFRDVAAAALRLLEIPKDLPDELVAQATDASADVNDLALTDLVSSLPQPLAPAENQSQRNFSEDESEAVAVAKAVPIAHFTGPMAPRFEGMTKREVLQRAAADGIPIDFNGGGVVRSQTPAPGSPLPAGQRVLVQLGR